MTICSRCRRPLPRYYRPDQVARQLNISTRTLYRWIKRGVISAISIKETGTVRVPAEAVDRFLRERQVSQPKLRDICDTDR